MNLKKKLLSIVMFCFSISVFAQLTDTGDKIGVGVNSPTTKLHIGSSVVPIDTYPPSAHNDYSKFKDYDILYLQRTSNSSIGPSLFFKGINNLTSYSARLALFSKGGANSDLAFLTSNSANYNQQEVMRLTYNGKVGIGTSNPSQRLHVLNGTIRGDLGGIGNSFIITGTGSNLQIKHDGGSQVALFNSGGGIDLRKTDGVSTILSAKNNGYVGIGTTSPKYKLDVLGTIRARELKVDMQGADFVFEENYPLLPISELEDFVKANKHLPEIAPAKEMQANGVNQSEMNQKLLQKIEELTLYTIEQDKKLKEQALSIMEFDEMKKEMVLIKSMLTKLDKY